MIPKSRPINIASRRGITTRSQNPSIIHNINERIKRKANSPAKETISKRSAFGDVTNAVKKLTTHHENKIKKQAIIEVPKKVTVHTKILPGVKTTVKIKQNENIEPPAEPKKKIVTRASLRNGILPTQKDSTVSKPKETVKVETTKVKTRLSNEFDKSEESLYTSALENL